MPAPAALLPELAEALRAADYGPAALRERLGIAMPDDVGLLNHAPALERLRADASAAGSAARLFYLEADERSAALRGWLPARQQRALTAVGLLAAVRGHLRCRLRIDAYRALYLLADRRFRAVDGRALRLPRGDMVYPPGSDSAMLADLVPPRDGEDVLDLCTGSGIQAISVAARARRVVAVDIGARAAATARLNAAFNRIDNVEVREGNLYGPVRGERFDLIIANPPFVPAPQRGPAYHSGGPRGDRVLRRVVEGLGVHLRPGGRAILISHLAVRAGETVEDAVRPWVDDFDGRTLVLVPEIGSPVDLAAAQALFALEDGFTAYGAEVRRWVRYLARHRIEQVALLLVVAERGGAPGFEVREAFPRTLPLPLAKPPGTLIAEWLR